MLEKESSILYSITSSSGSTLFKENYYSMSSMMESPVLHAAQARLSGPLGTRSSPTRSLRPAFCSDGHGHVLLCEPQLASHEFSFVGNTSLKKVLPCVCSCCSLHTLFFVVLVTDGCFCLFLFFFFSFFPCVR